MTELTDIGELFDVFDTEELRKKFNERQKKSRDKELDDLREVLKTPEGRRLLWRLLSVCGIFRISHVPKDSLGTAMNEGSRRIGLMILLDIMAGKPEAFTQMQREFMSNKAAEKAAIEKEQEGLNNAG